MSIQNTVEHSLILHHPPLLKHQYIFLIDNFLQIALVSLVLVISVDQCILAERVQVTTQEAIYLLHGVVLRFAAQIAQFVLNCAIVEVIHEGFLFHLHIWTQFHIMLFFYLGALLRLFQNLFEIGSLEFGESVCRVVLCSFQIGENTRRIQCLFWWKIEILGSNELVCFRIFKLFDFWNQSDFGFLAIVGDFLIFQC